MNIIFVILWTVVIVACAAGLVYCTHLKLQRSSLKTVMFIIPVLIAVLSVTLLILSTFIPQKMDNLLTQGIEQIETNINAISPDFTNQELDTTQLKSVINDTKMLKSSFDNDVRVNFIAKIVGINAYITFLNDFVENIETNVVCFEENKIPFTLDNIFHHLKQQTATPILKAVKTMEIIIITITLIINAINLALIFYYRKEQQRQQEMNAMIEQL